MANNGSVDAARGIDPGVTTGGFVTGNVPNMVAEPGDLPRSAGDDATGSDMQIFVKTVTTARTISLNVEASDAIQDV